MEGDAEVAHAEMCSSAQVCLNVLQTAMVSVLKKGYRREYFFTRQKLIALRGGIKEEQSPSVLSLNKPTKVNPNGSRMRLNLGKTLSK